MYYILYTLIICLLVIIDQYTKYLIVSNITLGSKNIIIDNFFDITYVRNYGAGFSILQNQKLLLVIFTLIVNIIIIYLFIKEKKRLYKIAYLLIISGSIGNFIDRIRLSYVVDFLDFNIFGYDFPVFNFADCLITIGCFVLIVLLIIEDKHAKN